MPIEHEMVKRMTERKNPGRVETARIRTIDDKRATKLSLELGPRAETVVIDFLNRFLRGKMRVRPATRFEDAGVIKPGENVIDEVGYQIDTVMEDEWGPVMVMQVTTATNPHVQHEKMVQISNEPTTRLENMRSVDVPIPKILIRLDPRAVELFLKDYNFDKHPGIGQKIINDIVAGLNYVIVRVKTDKERAKIQKLLDFFHKLTEQSH
jgi:hypothetical protein